MAENAWLKEKLRQKEAKLDKATEQLTKLLLEHQRVQLAHNESSKRLVQLADENKTLKEAIEQQLLNCKSAVFNEIDSTACMDRDAQQVVS